MGISWKLLRDWFRPCLADGFKNKASSFSFLPCCSASTSDVRWDKRVESPSSCFSFLCRWCYSWTTENLSPSCECLLHLLQIDDFLRINHLLPSWICVSIRTCTFFFLLRHGSKKFSAKDGPHIQAVKVVGWNGAVQRIAAAHTICPCALFKRQAQRPHAQQPLPYTHQCGRRKRLNRWEKEEHSKRFSSLQFSQRKQLDVPVEISRFLRKKNSPR